MPHQPLRTHTPHTHAHMYIHTHAHMYTLIPCTWAHICMRFRMRSNIHTHTHTDIFVWSRTHVCTCVWPYFLATTTNALLIRSNFFHFLYKPNRATVFGEEENVWSRAQCWLPSELLKIVVNYVINRHSLLRDVVGVCAYGWPSGSRRPVMMIKLTEQQRVSVYMQQHVNLSRDWSAVAGTPTAASHTNEWCLIM